VKTRTSMQLTLFGIAFAILVRGNACAAAAVHSAPMHVGGENQVATAMCYLYFCVVRHTHDVSGDHAMHSGASVAQAAWGRIARPSCTAFVYVGRALYPPYAYLLSTNSFVALSLACCTDDFKWVLEAALNACSVASAILDSPLSQGDGLTYETFRGPAVHLKSGQIANTEGTFGRVVTLHHQTPSAPAIVSSLPPAIDFSAFLDKSKL
jgi:hypothetical protein